MGFLLNLLISGARESIPVMLIRVDRYASFIFGMRPCCFIVHLYPTMASIFTFYGLSSCAGLLLPQPTPIFFCPFGKTHAGLNVFCHNPSWIMTYFTTSCI